ncbi:hypothetical protein CAAN1_13S00540 [[Candida] anglica]|uniref:Uncharacterized protein n=1 Tax=[Candida] anglica TaxID=148631 RepID=A0ABP0EFX7_9ASCO
MINVVRPAVEIGAFKEYKTPRKIVFDSSPKTNFDLSNLPIPSFQLTDNPTSYILLSQLANFWNYPSSYQVIQKLSKGTRTKKEQFVKQSNAKLNDALWEAKLITKAQIKVRMTYVEVDWLVNNVATESLKPEIVDEEDAFGTQNRGSKGNAAAEDDLKITVSQVFPQFNNIDSTIEYTHSAFNTLTNLSKYNYYTSSPSLGKFLPASKMSASEMELILKDTDFAEVEVARPGAQVTATTKARPETERKRKPIGRSKKYNTNIDPNSIDLSESLIPGQGYIPEFNVSHLCKVPNYYVTTNSATVAGTTGSNGSGGNTPSLKKSSSSLFGSSASGTNSAGAGAGATTGTVNGAEPTVKLAKNIQQLVAAAQENDNSSLSKYYYTMSYRGPGSGNYKDAALINKINKIPVTSNTRRIYKCPHKSLRQVRAKGRDKAVKYSSAVKGFIPDAFTKEFVAQTFDRQRNIVEDSTNLEILHNNLQFNILLNAYREISEDTWSNYYKFKLVDFEQLGMIQREKLKEAQRQQQIEEGAQPPPLPYKLGDRFNTPASFPELLTKIPVELRDEDGDAENEIPSIKRALDVTTTYPDLANPQLLTQVEVVKVPNANSIGWDNIKKYRSYV